MYRTDCGEKPIISIITRAYNVENYIEECAKSVINQSFEEFEWIVLENGSTDRTREILEEYAKKDYRIRLYINQKNYTGNVGQETGVYGTDDMRKRARGKYITNLDADDFLDIDFLKIMYEATKGEEVDIVAAGSFQFVNDNPKDINRIVVPKEFSGNNIAEMGENIGDFYDAFRPVWGKIVLKEFYLNNLEYISSRPAYVSNGGDTYTCLRMLQLAQRCICIQKPLYFHRVRVGSTSSSNYYKNRYLSYDAVFREGIRLLELWNKNTVPNATFLYSTHLGGMELNLKMISNVQQVPLEEKLNFIDKILTDNVYQGYVSVFNDANKMEWKNVIDVTLEKIYRACLQQGMTEADMLEFYRYNFGRYFMAQKMILEKKNTEYDIMLYMVAASSMRNTVTVMDDLLKICAKYILGKECASVEEVRNEISAHTNTGDLEYEKKKLLSEAIGAGNYEDAENILSTFDKKMILDCDVLFSKACCCYGKGNIKDTLVLLATANELYPNETIIAENLNSILSNI